MKTPYMLVTVFLALVLSACGASEPTGPDPVDSAFGEPQAVFAAAPSTETPTPFPSPSPVPTSSMNVNVQGMLTDNSNGTIHVNLFFQRPGGGDLGSLHTYLLLNEQNAEDATCYFESNVTGTLICDVSGAYETLSLKVTDGTVENRSCTMELPSREALYLSSEGVSVSAGCDF